LTVTEPPTLDGVLHALSRSEYDEVSDTKFEVVESCEGFSLRTQKYAVRFQRAEIPQLEVYQDGLKLFRLPSFSALWSPERKAQLSGVAVGIKHLVHDLGVDGFKEDWIGGVTRNAGVKMHQPVVGIEFERRFQFILHDEAHRWKPDALIETQTPNPLFRESSDVLRLNDIWYGARDVTNTMRRRAAIAHAAGWDLVDCDDASSTDLEEWWNYMQAQPAWGSLRSMALGTNFIARHEEKQILRCAQDDMSF
jgi:hypothetical protein